MRVNSQTYGIVTLTKGNKNKYQQKKIKQFFLPISGQPKK